MWNRESHTRAKIGSPRPRQRQREEGERTPDSTPTREISTCARDKTNKTARQAVLFDLSERRSINFSSASSYFRRYHLTCARALTGGFFRSWRQRSRYNFSTLSFTMGQSVRNVPHSSPRCEIITFNTFTHGPNSYQYCETNYFSFYAFIEIFCILHNNNFSLRDKRETENWNLLTEIQSSVFQCAALANNSQKCIFITQVKYIICINDQATCYIRRSATT